MPRISETTKGRVGPMAPGQFRELTSKANKPARIGKGTQRPDPGDWFIAKIKSNPVLLSGSSNRWRYRWEEIVLKDDNTTLATSTRRASGTEAVTYAINLCEICQAGSGTKIGPGVTISTLPSGFAAQPIAENTCVIMYALRRASGKHLFCFSMPNAIDGACA